MSEIKPNLKEVNLTIEALSGICVGGGENEKYSSDEYVNDKGKIYFLNLMDIHDLVQKGKLTDNLACKLYGSGNLNGIFKGEIPEEIKSVELKGNYENNLEIYRFAYNKKLTETGIVEVKTIMGSTIKGLIRHGFEIYNVENVKYDFRRNTKDNKLLIKGLKSINNKEEKTSLRKFPKGGFALRSYKCKDEFKYSVDKNFTDIIFRNSIFSDCELISGDFVIEKVESFSRTTDAFVIPAYYEIAEEGSVFKCKVQNKNIFNGKKEGNLSVIQVWYDDKTFIELSMESLKKYYSRVIDLEEEYYKIPYDDGRIKSFYIKLREENDKPNQFVCKLGYSGAVSKTLMGYESENKDALLPYNLKYMSSSKLPFGWVKIKLGEKL
ncbi:MULTISPECIES: hypothetical protein [Clostridium]|uniref:hypothetical protein n=1 Tax=Clostridium TaxID=1485 RepID=UPI0008258359|nr:MULTISPECIES: hypothetical protein [Clostridium]PJI06538.1 hypothetical protein CUB90_01065 [Clostridium sp. CT7]